MFFVVDVETSNLSPWHPDGYLLSVGIVPVTQTGDIRYKDYFYGKLQADLPPEWYDDDLPTKNETLIWWRQQDIAAQDEAYRAIKARGTLSDIALQITTYVEEIEPDKSQRYIAANPVAFDKMWMEYLFGVTRQEFPFHYRCLCLRSMKFGITDEPEFGSDRSGHEPDFPHVAWSDAFAEAKDLQDMIDFKNRIPSPRTYGMFRKFIAGGSRPE